MNWYDHLQTNIPFVFLNEALLDRHTRGDLFAILVHPFDVADRRISTIPVDAGINEIPGWVRCHNNKIVVTENLFHQCNHNDSYFATPIRYGIDKVLAPIYGYNQYLPTCCFGAPYLIKQGELDPDGTYLNGFEFAEVEYTAETTCIADLYRDAYMYEHSNVTNTYMMSNPNKWNSKKNKAIIDRKVSKISGPVGDRLADYGRLISFLLSKVKLTADEKVKLQPFLENIPDMGKLNEIALREEEILDIVSSKSASADILRKKFYN